MTLQRPHRPRLCAMALLALAALLVFAGATAAANPGNGISGNAMTAANPLVWFAPLPGDWPLGATGTGSSFGGSGDFMALFNRGAPWRRAAAHVKVFKIPQSWLQSKPVPRSKLRRIVASLKRRHIDLAVEALALPAIDCGFGVEGFSSPGSAGLLASTIKEAGGTLRYVAFDEPFAMGSLYDGPNACHWTAERVAREVAAAAGQLRRYFPKVVVGDIEPLLYGEGALVGWMDTYRTVTGKPLPFLHLDVQFFLPDWPQAAHKLEDAAHARGVRFGFIYIGEGDSDDEWTAEAERRLVEYEAKEGVRPDDVIFQSWLDRPDRVLPETKSGTFTWLVNRYFRTRTKLSLQPSGDGVSGNLSYANGRRVPVRRIVDLSATPLDGPGLYHEYTLAGTVPPGAESALVGYRVNTECICAGAADFTLYESRYQEAGGPNRVPNPRFDHGWEAWYPWGDGQARLESGDGSDQALHLTAAPGQVAGINGGGFPVTAGEPFVVTFAARVSPGSAGSGYFTVMFVGATPDIEISRSNVPISPGPVWFARSATDTRGAFGARLGSLPAGAYLVEAWFHGTSALFPSYAAMTTRSA